MVPAFSRIRVMMKPKGCAIYNGFQRIYLFSNSLFRHVLLVSDLNTIH